VIASSLLVVVAFVASRVAPRQAPYFLLLRQEKVSKEKATRVRVSLRCASVGSERGSPFLPLRWCKAPAAASGIPAPAPHPCGCAEQRREARIKRSACLSPKGEFADSPRFASSAGCPGAQHRGRKHQGRLSFAYFSLAKQRKVRRLPGRNPACHDSNHITK
jgi:hypothetical protein